MPSAVHGATPEKSPSLSLYRQINVSRRQSQLFLARSALLKKASSKYWNVRSSNFIIIAKGFGFLGEIQFATKMKLQACY